MPTYNLALIGYGNVGRALARLLRAKRDHLHKAYAIEFRVTAIATGQHGLLLGPQGIDLEVAARLTEGGGNLAELAAGPQPDTVEALLRTSQAQVMFENTPVDYQTGQPGLDHIRLALKLGMHAVTANKGPVVHGHAELTQLAAANRVKFLFESTVMDGAPLFALWRTALPAARLHRFRGVLNSTTNLVLGLVETGATFAEAIGRAQAMGIAETDPSGDIEGWDAAVKVAALVTVLMGQPLTPDQVRRQGIDGLSESQIRTAHRAGNRWKLICQAEDRDGSILAAVGPQLLAPDDPLYSVEGTTSAITFETDVLGALTLREQDPSPDTTAYGLLADFVNAVRGG